MRRNVFSREVRRWPKAEFQTEGLTTRYVLANADKSLEAWQQSFMSLGAAETKKTYNDAIASKAVCLGDINFHSAAVDRLLEHAWLSPELSDGQRKACTGFATRGIELVAAMWTTNDEVVERFHRAIENATACYIPFSSPTVREFKRELSPPHSISPWGIRYS